MLGILFEQPPEQIFRRLVQLALGDRFCDVKKRLFVLFDGSARVVNLIEIFELVFVVVLRSLKL